MPDFAFTALDPRGSQTAGVIAADNRAAALDLVIRRGLTPVSVSENTAKAAANAVVAKTGRVPRSQTESFTRELANLLSAGVPLSRALTILIRESRVPAAKACWTALHDDVVGGGTLADSLARWPDTFTPVYIAMVRAGETGGFLDVVLAQISEFQSREQDLKGKVKAALVYPLVLAVLSVLVMIFLLIYFIPRFSLIFKDLGENLPLLTRIIVGASETLIHRGPLVLIAGVVVYFLLKRVMASPSGRRAFESLTLKTPMLGDAVARFALIRFARMLGTLSGAGVGLLNALRVAKEAVGNQILSDAVNTAIEEVREGASLSKSLAKCERLFPPSVIEMIAVAEETGRLDKELLRIATSLEGDLDRRLRMLVALAEPMLLFVMAAVIGTVVVGMLMPLFQLQDMIK